MNLADRWTCQLASVRLAATSVHTRTTSSGLAPRSSPSWLSALVAACARLAPGAWSGRLARLGRMARSVLLCRLLRGGRGKPPGGSASRAGSPCRRHLALGGPGDPGARLVVRHRLPDVRFPPDPHLVAQRDRIITIGSLPDQDWSDDCV